MPKSFIAENVRGLIQGTSKGYFNKILHEFKKSGYDIRGCVLKVDKYDKITQFYKILIV
jgi:site-specific DNA-cytosine methylase